MSLSLNLATASPVIRKFNQFEFTFPILTIKDWGLLGAKLAAKNRESQKETIKMLLDAGAVKASALGALIRELSRNPTYYEINNYVMEPDGAIETLFISAQKQNKDITKEQIGELCEIEKLVATAVEVAGMDDIFIEESKSGANKDFLEPTLKTPIGQE